MTSTSKGLRIGVAGAAMMGLLVLSGCPGDDSGETSDTMAMTTTADTGMEETGMEETAAMDSSGGDAPSHADIQPIWDEHCTAACHESGGEWALLDLTSGAAYSALQGMSTQATDLKFVEPGDADASYLWHKINGTQAAAGGGGVDMPKPRTDGSMTTMTQEQLDMVEAWIAGGAAE